MDFCDYKGMIILASESWLRKTVLTASKLNFIVKAAKIDERTVESEYSDASAEELVSMLADKKAEAVAKDNPHDLVIAADTLAVLPDGTWLHKPATHEEAIELSLKQSGKTIRAVTGLAMRYRDQTIINTTTTNITYISFDEAMIEKLLAGDDPAVRNSGLGFFVDAPGFTLVKKFDGSYTGAMGLPMEHVWNNLEKLGYASGSGSRPAS